VPTIDIDRDAAHEAAQHELAKPIYPKASLIDRLKDWIGELLAKLISEAASVPGGWFTVTVLLILLTIAVVVAVRIARRTMRTNRGGGHALFGEHELSAAEHRATAEQYAAVGNWSAAIRHRLRAVARQLEERTSASSGAQSGSDNVAAFLSWIDSLSELGLDGYDLTEIGLKSGNLVVDDRDGAGDVVAAAAANLHGVVDGLPCHFTAPQFAHGGFKPDVRMFVARDETGSEQRHCFHGKSIGRHARDCLWFEQIGVVLEAKNKFVLCLTRLQNDVELRSLFTKRN